MLDKETEIPTDLHGRFLLYRENKSVQEINDFIEDISEKYLGDALKINRSFNYEKLKQVDDLPINTFLKEYNKLDSMSEKALYLAERIVFDSYIQNPYWWKDRISEITDRNTTTIQIAVEILNNIISYMSAWRPPSKDYSKIKMVSTKLIEQIHKINDNKIQINPVVLINGYDYLGLAYNKLARKAREDEIINQSISYLENSIDYLNKCIKLAKKYEKDDYRIWEGYAYFNRARSYHDLITILKDPKNIDIVKQIKNNNDEIKYSDERIDCYVNKFKKDFEETRTIREDWKNRDYGFPSVIKNGLITEYYHAVAERILRAQRDKQGNIDEKGDYAITSSWIIDKIEEYREWWDKPGDFRVKLAVDVKQNWDKIINEYQNK